MPCTLYGWTWELPTKKKNNTVFWVTPCGWMAYLWSNLVTITASQEHFIIATYDSFTTTGSGSLSVCHRITPSRILPQGKKYSGMVDPNSTCRGHLKARQLWCFRQNTCKLAKLVVTIVVGRRVSTLQYRCCFSVNSVPSHYITVDSICK